MFNTYPSSTGAYFHHIEIVRFIVIELGTVKIILVCSVLF